MFDTHVFPRDYLVMWHVGARLGVAPVTRFLRRAHRDGLRTLVDVGAGGGSNSLLAAREGFHVACCDLVETCLRETRRRARQLDAESRVWPVRTNALRLPFPDAAFDVAIASHIIEHLDNPKGLLRELDRVLKPGGLLRLACPTPYHGMRLSMRLGYRLDPPDHRVIGYSVSDIASMLPETMAITRTTYQGRILESNLADAQHVVSRLLGVRANPVDDTVRRDLPDREIGWLMALAKELVLGPAVALCKLEDALLPFMKGSMMSLEIVKVNEPRG